MKKPNIIFHLILIAILFYSCSDSSKQKLTKDSSNFKQESESTPDDFITADLTKFGWFQGHVKCCVTKRFSANYVENKYIANKQDLVYSDTLYFSQNGVLEQMSMNYFEDHKLSWNYIFILQYDENNNFIRGIEQINNAKVFIGRNNNNQITIIDVKGENSDGVDDVYTEITWKDGLPVSEEKNYWEWTEKISYKYFDNQVIEKKSATIGYENETEIIETYEYQNIDINNNWTNRNIRLDYADCWFDLETEKEIERQTYQPQYYVEIRDIIYW